MGLAVLTASRIELKDTATVLTAPEIKPASAPTFVAPISTPMALTPVPAPPVPGSTLGTGGTPFNLSSGAVRVSPWYSFINRRIGSNPYSTTMPRNKDNDNVPETPSIPAPGGAGTVVPVPSAPRIPKPKLGDAIPEVPTPGRGPVRGTVAGFDLSTVPLWAWLVAAAVIGSKLLK